MKVIGKDKVIMKKLFNHTKRPVNGWEESDYDWDSEVDPEEGYTEEGRNETFRQNDKAWILSRKRQNDYRR